MSIHTWCEPIIYVRNIIIGRNKVIHSYNRLIQFVMSGKKHFLAKTFKMSLIMLNPYRHQQFVEYLLFEVTLRSDLLHRELVSCLMSGS